MNKYPIKIIVNNGDDINYIAKHAIKLVNLNLASYCVFTINDVKIFVNKDDTVSTIIETYNNKLKNK